MIQSRWCSDVSLALIVMLLAGMGSLTITTNAWAQEQARHTLEVGGVGQTSADLITAPYTTVKGISGSTIVGTPNEQAFGGPLLGYRYALTRNFALEARGGFLFGHQPTVYLSGGNELLLHAGIRASLPMGRFSLYGRIAPGLSSFSSVSRFFVEANTPPQELGRITHFSVDKGVGLNYKLGPHTALSFDVSDMSLVEGDEFEGTIAPIPCVPPYNTPCLPNGGVQIISGNVEEHLLATFTLERSFGKTFEQPAQRMNYTEEDRHLRNQILFLWANQPQQYLSVFQDDLVASNGFGVDFSHAVRRWLDMDAAFMTFPGGDGPSIQDGGSKTEVFAGVKVGIRRRYYGVFVKVRPGMVTSPDTINTELVNPPPMVRNYNFAIDLGGVVEIYPKGSHFAVRLDLGEVGTEYSAVKVATPNGYATQPATSRDSGLYTLGVGWRF